jgi:predicted enzyme related to lactoylglutathione lyase
LVSCSYKSILAIIPADEEKQLFVFTFNVKSDKMKKAALIVFAITASFFFGFAFKTITTNQSNKQKQMKKVTGIGGIFFKCKDPQKMREWYQKNLGLNTNQYGAVFEWRQGADSTKKGYTNWSPFAEKTKYFEPSTKDFMINYRVADLEAFVEELKKSGVTILDTTETYDYGKFVHILDAEGNKIELWEPNDIEYEKLGEQMGSKTTK